MATLVIRDLDPGVKARLQRRAASNGRSMEAEARSLLADAVDSRRPAHSLGSAIRRTVAVTGGVDLPIPERQELPRAVDPG